MSKKVLYHWTQESFQESNPEQELGNDEKPGKFYNSRIRGGAYATTSLLLTNGTNKLVCLFPARFPI